MGEKEIVLLTAKQARSKAEFSECCRRRVAKMIESAANENKISCNFDLFEVDPAVKNDLINWLKDAGYQVSYPVVDDMNTVDYSSIIIQW